VKINQNAEELTRAIDSLWKKHYDGKHEKAFMIFARKYGK